jgi:hypothetical protein
VSLFQRWPPKANDTAYFFGSWEYTINDSWEATTGRLTERSEPKGKGERCYPRTSRCSPTSSSGMLPTSSCKT